ncbi:hypothetical protein L7F22_056756 [Adiantum nelumboides]|nr:hypothetical protein [Adiantum nelumboides]
MATVQTEALEVDYSTTDAPALATKHDDTSLVSTETGAIECKQYAGPVDRAGVMHSGNILDSAGLEYLESSSGSVKEIPGDTEAPCRSGSIAPDDYDDSREGGLVPDITIPSFDKIEAFEFDQCAVDSVNSAEVQAAASEQDGAMRASARTEGRSADDSQGSPTEQGIVRSSEDVYKIEEEATILSLKGNKGHVTAPVSTTCVNQEVTSSSIMASSREESFEVPASDKLEGRKFMDTTFHDLEENEVAEHAYDIDFDIDAHDMPLEESFFDEGCMFPTLDAEKPDVWHAGVDNVIMEESSARPRTNLHPEDVHMQCSPEEINDKPGTMHEAKENEGSSEEWRHSTQHQLGCETVLVDDPHEMDESDDLSNRQEQGSGELAGYPCNKTGLETLASGVAQDKELTCKYSKDEDAQEIRVQYDTDDIFASLANANVETVLVARTSEAKRPEEEVSTEVTVKEIECEPTSVNMPQEDAAVHLPKVDDDLPGDLPASVSVTANFNLVSRHIELHTKSEDPLEGSRHESCFGQEEVITQDEDQGKGTSEGSDYTEEDVCRDMKLSVASEDAQLVAIDSSEALGASSSALMMSDSQELEHVPFACEQGENTLVTAFKEVSSEAVSEPIAQTEASTLEQNAMNDSIPVNICESQHVFPQVEAVSEPSAQEEASTLEVVAMQLAVNQCESQHFLSQVEAGTLQYENQSDERTVEDGKPVKAIGVSVLLVRNSVVKENSECRDETVEVGKGAEQEGKAWNEEHEQSYTKLADGFNGSSPGQNESALKKIDVSGDEVEEGNGAEHAKSRSNEERKESDGRSMGFFNGSFAETGKRCMREISVSGDGITGAKIALSEGEIAGKDEESEGHSLLPLAGVFLPQAASAKMSKKEEDCPETSILPLSFSVSENNVSSGTDNNEKLRVGDGLKSAPAEKQSAALLMESSELRRVSPFTPSKEQSKKVISDDKLPKAELSYKPNLATVKETKEGDRVGDYAKCQSELGEESSVKKVQRPVKQGLVFKIGDLVWAKVRSHPWWPAQIFDPADASKSARKAKKSGRVLVAFFGDCTFAWLQQSQMIAFRPNFKEKVQQTSLRVFCLAVEEALEELCRRSELGLSCRHFEGSLHSTSSFPDANTGIREGVRVERFKDIRTSAEMFRPKKTLEFVKNVAAAPLGAWSSTLQWAELRGHAYGLRTCMVAIQGLDLDLVLPSPLADPSQGSKSSKINVSSLNADPSQGLKPKRSFSSLNAEDITDAGHSGKESQKHKKLKSDKGKRTSEPDKDRKDSEGKGIHTRAVSGEGKKQVSSGNVNLTNSGMKDLTDTRERNTDRNIIKIKLSRRVKDDHLSRSEKCLDSPLVEVAGSESNLDDGKETLLAIAGHSGKALKRLSLKEEKTSSTSKKVRREECQNDTSKYGAVKASLAEAFSDMNSDAPFRPEVDTDDASNVLPSPSKHSVKKTEWLKTGLKKEASVKDNSAGKNESVRKFSKVGDCIRRVASELKGTPVVKGADDVRYTGPEVKTDLDQSPRERHASPNSNKTPSKESLEDVSLLQLREDLELLSKKSGSGGAKGKTVKASRKSDRSKGVAEKSSPQWQSVPQRSQRSCVQELALAARKRKSELVHDETLSKVPKNSSSSGSQWHHASKGYITSAEKPGERKSYDKSLLLYSRRSAPPASSMKSSSQHYDEKLSSHAPLGLFMRFPEDFPLPSEAQLKAIFIPFGPLQMSATKLYKDSASAQVVFKHGRDAESALKHAKKNPMFGQVAVTYRLRHLSHSTRIEMKTDTPSSNKAYSSQVAALREPASSRAKLGGSSASLAKGTRDKDVVSSTMLSSSNPVSQLGSEPTGDIQDQMMTLLRQVSVIVNTSPVTSDGP